MRDHRLDLGPQAVRDRPLDIAEVIRPGQHNRVTKPWLLHDPVESGQTVRTFLTHRIEVPAGAECAAHALHDHLEPTLGIRPGHPETDEAGATVWTTEQRHRQRLAANPRCPPVCQELHAVWHRKPQIPFDHEVTRQRRLQPHRPLKQVAHRIRLQPRPPSSSSPGSRQPIGRDTPGQSAEMRGRPQPAGRSCLITGSVLVGR